MGGGWALQGRGLNTHSPFQQGEHKPSQEGWSDRNSGVIGGFLLVILWVHHSGAPGAPGAPGSTLPPSGSSGGCCTWCWGGRHTCTCPPPTPCRAHGEQKPGAPKVLFYCGTSVLIKIRCNLPAERPVILVAVGAGVVHVPLPCPTTEIGNLHMPLHDVMTSA